MEIFRNILYVSELSGLDEAALRKVVALAKSHGARLTVLHVVPGLVPISSLPTGAVSPVEWQQSLLKQRESELEALVAPLRDQLDIEVGVREGKLFIEVIRATLAMDFDLVVKPSENPDFLQRVFGSNDVQLLRKCPCPVWLTGPDEPTTYHNILAAVDFDLDRANDVSGDTLNRRILGAASSLALDNQATLHLVHVWEAPAELMIRTWSENPEQDSLIYVEAERSRHARALESTLERLKRELGSVVFERLKVQPHLIRGTPSRAIPQLASQLGVELVIMGTVARAGISGVFIGNTAEAILEQLQCGVLAIKPEGFVSPVTLPG